MLELLEQTGYSGRLKALAELISASLDARQIEQLEVLSAVLRDWAPRNGLTAIVDPEQIAVRHVLDSLTVLTPLLLGPATGSARLVDVGAGAGFPGLVLAIACPDLDVVLIEAAQKKVRFIEYVVGLLGLSNARPVCGRAEDLGHDALLREHFDVGVARAVGSVATLVELVAPFVHVGGRLALMKTRAQVTLEIDAAGPALTALGCTVELLADVSVPDLLHDRVVLLLRKEEPTVARYPRRAGLPQRRPLA